MKLAITIADANGLIHAGLDVDRVTRVFEMPPEMLNWIGVRLGNDPQYKTVSFSVIDEGGQDGNA